MAKNQWVLLGLNFTPKFSGVIFGPYRQMTGDFRGRPCGKKGSGDGFMVCFWLRGFPLFLSFVFFLFLFFIPVAGIMMISICFSRKPTDPETQKFKLQTWESLKRIIISACTVCFDHIPWRFVLTVLHMNFAGIITLPIFDGIKQCTCMETFEGFHLNSSLFWVGNMMTSVPRCSM